MADFASGIGVLFVILGFLTSVGGQIWLIASIAKETPGLALLYLIVPFLIFFFMQDNWDEIKAPALMWGSGVLLVVMGGLLQCAAI